MRDFLLDLSFDSRDAALEELVSARLFMTLSAGSASTEINGTTTVSAWFKSAEDRRAARVMLSDLEDMVELGEREEERIDWLDRYEQSLEPISVGTRFVVVPDARLIAPDDRRLAIIVPQEQAFGTGSHETTALCIALLETLETEGQRGLDIGTGSGILAIAMHRLGAARVIAFDNDPDAYAALRDNRIRNAVSPEAMPLFIGGTEALRGGVFDLVTMNIIPEVILPLLGSVVERMSADARLVLSGILLVRRDEVVAAAMAHGLRLVDERERGEWWAGVLARGM
ncbi:MAG TPA: 50S ribosomal protein L11 methyltransferase [Thermoanaerobaculia bacterium]